MRKRKSKNDVGMAKPAMGLVKGGVVLGVGGSVISSVGGNAAGVSTMAGFMPAMGAAMGGGIALQQVRKIQKQTRKRKK